MGKFYLLFIAFMIISCEEEDMLVPKTAAREVPKAAEKEAPKIAAKEVPKIAEREVPKAVAKEVKEVADPGGVLIAKAREMEAFLQKQADSIVRQFDSLGVPK
ncbi:MAG: hypothetical protein FWF67_05200 [Fibromonadales bacterium]|nr:hypothetical protein [Fibromonadales bacterium]